MKLSITDVKVVSLLTVRNRFYLSLALLLTASSDYWSKNFSSLQSILFGIALGALLCFGLIKAMYHTRNTVWRLAAIGNVLIVLYLLVLVAAYF